MAEYQKIEYRIGQDGKVTETVLNGQGESCVMATEVMEAALGTVKLRELLPEYDGDQDNPLTIDPSQSIHNSAN